MSEVQEHSAAPATSHVKEKSIGTVPKTSLESDAQPVVPACSLSVRVKSPDWLWVVCSEFLDSMPSVVEAASQVFDQVQVMRPADFLEDFVFEKLLETIPVCTHGLLIAPHSTFTHQVRGVTAQDIYGKAGLSSEVKARVRTRCGDIAARLQCQGTPWIIVSPCSEEPSLFDLPEVSGLLSHPGVNQAQVDLQDFSCACHNIIRVWGNVNLGVTGWTEPDGGENYFPVCRQEKLCVHWCAATFSLLRQDLADTVPDRTNLTKITSDNPVSPKLSFTAK